jgi:hypothetical protein
VLDIARRSLSTNSVELIDEDDRGRSLPCGREELAEDRLIGPRDEGG